MENHLWSIENKLLHMASDLWCMENHLWSKENKL